MAILFHFLFPSVFPYSADYLLSFKIRFFISYLFVFLFSYLFEYSNEVNQMQLAAKNNELDEKVNDLKLVKEKLQHVQQSLEK